MKIKVVLAVLVLIINYQALGAEQEQTGEKVVYGLAAKYPGDEGIGQDKAVLFHDDFESGRPGWRWDHVRGVKHIEAETNPNIARGEQSAKFVLKRGRNSDTTIWKWVPEQDELYMRHYARYGDDYGYQYHGGSGYCAMSNYQFGPGGHAGRAPKGDKLFWNTLEPSGRRGKYETPGALNFYAYWWKMKKTLGKRSYGNRFMTEPPQVPEKCKWMCIEWRVKVNTAGEDDGELDCWVNGIKCGQFRGINWRSDENLRVNQVKLSLYLAIGGFDRVGGGDTRTMWYDDVVVATEYIGPKVEK